MFKIMRYILVQKKQLIFLLSIFLFDDAAAQCAHRTIPSPFTKESIFLFLPLNHGLALAVIYGLYIFLFFLD